MQHRLRSFALAVAVAVVAAGALAACGGKSKGSAAPGPSASPAPTEPAPAAGPTDAELEALFGRSLDFFDAMAAAVESAGDDCPAMAKALDGVFTSHQALLTEVKAFEGNEDVDRKADAYMEQHKDRVQAAMTRVGEGLGACAGNADVAAVMQRFDEM